MADKSKVSVDPVDLGKVLAQVQGAAQQSQQNSQQIVDLRKEFSEEILHLRQDFTTGMNMLSADIKAMRQDPGATSSRMAVWAGVIIAFIMAVFTPIGYFAIREWDNGRAINLSLDAKLQREFATANADLEKQVELFDKHAAERDAGLRETVRFEHDRTDALSRFVIGQVEEDLKELRARRLKDK